MTRILVVPERLKTLAVAFRQTAVELRNMERNLRRAAMSLDWEIEGRRQIEAHIDTVCTYARSLADITEQIADSLFSRAESLYKADQQGAGALAAHTAVPFPKPVPTPTPIPSSHKDEISLDEMIRSLDQWFQPIDWLTDSQKASREFYRRLEDIGRWLNHVTGRRGHIKIMKEFGNFLRGTSESLGAIANFLDARDLQRYFRGELTNKEIAERAIEALVPIPMLDSRLAKWLTKNMVNPNGFWKGLAPPVE